MILKSNYTEQEIINLYDSGLTYKELFKITNNSYASLLKLLKGRRGYGKCWTKPEQKFRIILNELNIGVKFPDILKIRLNLVDDNFEDLIYFQYPVQRYVCDFVDENNKIIFEINGDFWHANPLLYDLDNLTKIQKHNIRQDKNKLEFLSLKGYKICVIWESEIYYNIIYVKNKIRAMRKMVNPSALQAENTAFDSQIAHINEDWSSILKTLWFKPPKVKTGINKICASCGKEFYVFKSKINIVNCCSEKCSGLYCRKVERPSKEELGKLLWETPTIHIAKKYGVTDKAVAKWAKSYDLKKPPRGYWAMQRKIEKK